MTPLPTILRRALALTLASTLLLTACETTGRVTGPSPTRDSDNEPAASPRLTPWLAGSDYNARFDPQTLTVVDGTVEAVGTFVPETGAMEGLSLTIKTADGSHRIVHVGPRGFSRKHGSMQFNYQDPLHIIGSAAEVRGETVVLAMRITRGDDSLRLRDGDGTPAWTREQLANLQDRTNADD